MKVDRSASPMRSVASTLLFGIAAQASWALARKLARRH